jgi:hypothetical protein
MKYKRQCSECENIIDTDEWTSFPVCEVHRERSERKDCEKGVHSQRNPEKQYDDGFDCDCGAKIRRGGALNMEA